MRSITTMFQVYVTIPTKLNMKKMILFPNANLSLLLLMILIIILIIKNEGVINKDPSALFFRNYLQSGFFLTPDTLYDNFILSEQQISVVNDHLLQIVLHQKWYMNKIL